MLVKKNKIFVLQPPTFRLRHNIHQLKGNFQARKCECALPVQGLIKEQ